MSEATIEVTGLRKRFGAVLALDGMSFSVQPGQVTGFIGPNGAGKSTTMRVVLGLDAVEAGSALVGGQRYRSLRHPLTVIGSLLDAAALQPSRTARNHLLWLARSQGLGRRRVDEVIGQSGLEQVARRKAGGFSLGMRQRLGIAAALLGDPRVLMLDEPFNGMDPEGIVWMRGFLRSLAVQGRAVLVSSHLMSELQGTADHLVIVGRGTVIADTSTSDLLARAAGGRVTLRTTAAAAAMAALQNAGGSVSPADAGALSVTGLEAEKIVALLSGQAVPFSEVAAHRASLEEAYLDLTRDAVEYRAMPAASAEGGRPVTTSVITKSRPGQRAGRAGFAQLLSAEWTKFATVRGWVIGLVLAPLLTVGIALLNHSSCGGVVTPGGPVTTGVGCAAPPTGPGGEAVTDSFYFVRQPLAGDGSITVRLTSLSAGPGPDSLSPWAKAGIIIKASAKPGSAYAAMMVTAGHGVRMQYNYTGDIAGPAGKVSAASPRWLRLTRTGDTITGYSSVNGARWSKVGTAYLAGFPATAAAGMFAAAPASSQATSQSVSGSSSAGALTLAVARFDHVSLAGPRPARAWTGGPVGGASTRHRVPPGRAARSPSPGPATSPRTCPGPTARLAPPSAARCWARSWR